MGCSDRFNANLSENVTLQVAADAEYNLAGKKESWTMNPSRSIVMHEPPAHLYSENGSKLVFHWHYARGSTTLSFEQLERDNQESVSPILFVDGHGKT